MLQQLLTILKRQPAPSVAEIAYELAVPVGLVEAMMEQLSRKGYLTEMNSCATPCEDCTGKTGCLLGGQRFWQIKR